MRTIGKGLSRLLIFLLLLSACAGKQESPRPAPVANEFILPDPPQYGTPFADVPATDDIVMYEVNLRAFSPANIQGVIGKLDHIQSLGVNVIWLMPVFPIGIVNTVNSPYCVKNYRQVNSEFGSLSDLRELTEEAHVRGMAVILDWVANHTAWDNPWMKYKSWYTTVNGSLIHPEGTNWQDVADLNFNSAVMRKAMISAMKYWVLDANIDGFRCDAADMVPYDFWKQAIDSLQAIPGRSLILLAEGARNDHFTAGFQLNYAWDFYGKLKAVFSGQPAGGLFTTHTNEYNSIPAGKHKLRFTTNHDESAWDATPVTLFGGIKGAMAAQVIATFLGGVPMIYSSQEVGRSATLPFFSNSPVNWNENPDMLAAYRHMMEFYTLKPAAGKGDITWYAFNDVCLFTKTNGEEQILVMVNVRNTTVTFEMPPLPGLFHDQHTPGRKFVAAGNTVVLEPYAYIYAERVDPAYH